MEERDLGALIENGLKDLAGRIDESRMEARQRFEQVEGEIRQVKDEIHQTQIHLEDVHDDIKLLAEGIANVDEKLERHVGETAQQFDDVRALVRISYVQLEQRVARLEGAREI
jgi:septal ring factor EnvC (AmiA/AmiB activator)